MLHTQKSTIGNATSYTKSNIPPSSLPINLTYMLLNASFIHNGHLICCITSLETSPKVSNAIKLFIYTYNFRINIYIWCSIISNLYLLNKINNYLQLQHSTPHKVCENVKPQSSGLSNKDKTTIGI